MSYFLDDDNDDDDHDDGAFGGALGGLSQQSIGDGVEDSQQINNLSQESNFPFSQESLLSQLSTVATTATRSNKKSSYHMGAELDDNNDEYFLCEACGNDKSYVDDSTGALTCTVCFTQSQTYVASSQQEVEFDDAMGMAARARDGRLLQSQSSAGSVRSRMSGTGDDTEDGRRRRRGRPQKSDTEYDNSQPLPSLEECLCAFVTVLKASTKRVCLDLLPVPVTMSDNDSDDDGKEDDGDEDEEENDFFSPNRKRLPSSNATSKRKAEERRRRYHVEEQKQRQMIYKQVLSVAKELWKLYLENWQEGAEYYASRYPQARFSMRDSFLLNFTKRKLYKVLADRAATNLRKKIEEEDEDDTDDDDSDIDSSEGKSNLDRGSNKVGNMKINSSKNKSGVKRKLKSISRQRGNNDLTTTSDTSTSSSEGSFSRLLNKRRNDDRNTPKSRRKKTFSGNGAKSASSTSVAKRDELSKDILKDEVDGEVSFLGEDLDLEDDQRSTKSDLSDDEGHVEREIGPVTVSNTIMRIVKVHNQQRDTGKNGSQITTKQRDAALLITPSMKMVIGMILIAASPYGVTSSLLIGWVASGALPLLDAYRSILLKGKKSHINRKLKAISSFFSLRSQPTDEQLRHIAKRLHVACGYRPPAVKLLSKKRKNCRRNDEDAYDKIQITDLTDKRLSEAGRLIRPSNVSVSLAQLILSLGLSQTILNYSLVIMGLPVASRSLSFTESSNTNSKDPPQSKDVVWLPPKLPSARADKISTVSDLLAVIVVACKLVPGWEKQLKFGKETRDIKHRGEHDGEDGTILVPSKMHDNSVDDSFAPWNPRIFSNIGNGTLEEGYIRFLESGSVINTDIMTLPKTAKLFLTKKAPEKSIQNKAYNSNKEGPVVQSKVVIDVYSESERGTRTQSSLSTTNSIIYRRIACTDALGVMPLPLPEGPLIEYLAGSTGVRTTQIVKLLIQLEGELAATYRKKRLKVVVVDKRL